MGRGRERAFLTRNPSFSHLREYEDSYGNQTGEFFELKRNFPGLANWG
jgi:hypothetical protein